MLNKEKLEQLMGILGDLTDEQKAYLAEALNGKINEKEIFEKLGVDDGKFAEFLKALAAQREDDVLGQELSADEMAAATGGKHDGCNSTMNECWNNVARMIQGMPGHRGFPDCAATVEDGSMCDTNDACWVSAVIYSNMEDCSRAWH